MRGGLLFLLVMCLTLNGFSGRLVGGEISYTQIGADSYLIELLMYRDCYVYIPNAFSPNGDSLNDIWYPSVFVWKTYNLRIFDRWGKEIFQSNNPNEGWNGEAHRSGVLSPIVSYSHLINIEGPDSRQWQAILWSSIYCAINGLKPK